jgi:hypothetical protein
LTIVVQDVYLVVGRDELPFEAALHELYADAAEPPVGDLVLAAWLPHGGGEGYEAVTIRALADGEELQRLIDWNRGEAGRAWSTRIEAMCYHQHSTLHELVGGSLHNVQQWSTDPSEQRPPLFRLDVLTLERALKADDLVAPASVVESDLGNVVEPIAYWQPLSALGEPVLSVLYGFPLGGLARSAELLQVDDLWPGELALPATARTTRMLRGARSILASTDRA